MERFVVDHFEDDGLSARFHGIGRETRGYTIHASLVTSIHRFLLIESIVACINILSDAYRSAVA
jgi:hypothetical protein